MKKTFEEFTKAVVEGLFESRPEVRDSVEIDTKEVLKNNGVKLIALTIREKDSNITPNIYLNDFYHDYEEGKELDEIIPTLEDMWEKAKIDMPKFDISVLSDYSNVKEQISAKLINAEKNSELLAQCPHTVIGDLAVLYIIILDKNQFGAASITITNDTFTKWDITKETLMADAINNFSATSQSICDVITELLAARNNAFPLGFEEPLDAPNIPMIVISNTDKTFGAFAMLKEKELKKVAEKEKSNLFILPSSVHELIAVPDDNALDPIILKGMVEDVNASEVCEQDKLSDNVYYYDAKENALKYADTKETIYSF